MKHPIRNSIVYLVLCIVHGAYADLVTVAELVFLERLALLAPIALLYIAVTANTKLALPGFDK